MSYRFVLIPGRHHAVTRFQADYLASVLAGEATDADGVRVDLSPEACVIWAITSASHAWTRRNPLPGHRREALVERVALAEGLPSVVVPVPDVPQHPRFAHLVLTTAATALPHLPACDPTNTVVACSTPSVAASYAAMGFRILPVEAGLDQQPVRPWEVVERCAGGDATWADLAHPETVVFYDRYGYGPMLAELFADPVVSAEGDLTGTRNYRTYAAAFETASDRKWEIVGPYVESGRVVDVGCATGGLLERIAADPRFGEADLFGVDIARPLLAEAEHKLEAGAFVNPNVWFLRANILNGPVMAPGSVDSTISVALTHEVYSYGDGRADVELFARRVFDQTRPGGVWVNSDVVGPGDPDRLVRLTLTTADGEGLDVPVLDLDSRQPEDVSAFVEGLSTAARLVQFAHDFPRLSGSAWTATPVGDATWVLRLADAMEFLATKDYHVNWLSECHEQFCGLSFADWVTVLGDAGFSLDPASHASTNDWIVSNRLAPTATMVDAGSGEAIPWPDTHVLTVARRPFG